MCTQGHASPGASAVEGAFHSKAQERGGQEAGLPHQLQGLGSSEGRAAEHCAQAAAPLQPVRPGHQLC